MFNLSTLSAKVCLVSRIEAADKFLYAVVNMINVDAPRAVYRFTKTPSCPSPPIHVGDAVYFIDRDPPEGGATVLHDFNAQLPGRAPLFLAGAAPSIVHEHFNTLFGGSSDGAGKRFALRATAGSFAARVSCVAAPESAASYLTRLSRCYIQLREAAEVITSGDNGARIGLLPKEQLVVRAPSKRGPGRGAPVTRAAPKRVRSPAAEFIMETANVTLDGEVTPRQLEYFLMTWYNKHAFRSFELLGIPRKAVSRMLGCSRLRGSDLHNKAACGPARGGCPAKYGSWCGRCSETPIVEKPTSGGHGKVRLAGDSSLFNLHQAIIGNPFAFAGVPYHAAVRIHNATHDEEPCEEREFCGTLVRRLAALESASCEIFAPSHPEFALLSKYRSVADAVYGIKIYERPGGELCAYAFERFKIEGTCAKFIAATFGVPSAPPPEEAAPATTTLLEGGAAPATTLSGGAAPVTTRRLPDKAAAVLSLEQQAAVNAVVNMTGQPGHRITCITGGPGVGKTRVLGAIVAELARRESRFRLTAFTGKAVVRIREQTSCPAKYSGTLDRLIMKRDVSGYEHLIIDEASMVAPELFARFISAHISDSAKSGDREPVLKVTLVGDVDQLPPIGWGSLFANVLSMPEQYFPRVVLTKSYRIAGDLSTDPRGSEKLAQLFSTIKSGGELSNVFSREPDDESIRVIEHSPASALAAVIADLASERAIASPSDMVIIAPYNTTVDSLNKHGQSLFMEVDSANAKNKYSELCVGDRVIMTKNVYMPTTKIQEEDGGGLAFMNGDVGTVVAVEEGGLTVKFDSAKENALFGYRAPTPAELGEARARHPDRKLQSDDSVSESDYEEFIGLQECGADAIPMSESALHVGLLKKAFAVTVHKSQGSEYEHVVVVVPRAREDRPEERGAGAAAASPPPDRTAFLNRPLLYTAVTRARKTVTIITAGTLARDVQAVVGRMPPPRTGNLLYRTASLVPKGRVDVDALRAVQIADEKSTLQLTPHEDDEE